MTRRVVKAMLVVLAGWPLTVVAQTQASVDAPTPEVPAVAAEVSGPGPEVSTATPEVSAPAPEAPAPAEAPASDRPSRWGASANLGFGSVSGEFSSLLTKPISGELNLFRVEGAWRFGLGISFGSFSMRPPYIDGLEWGFLQNYLTVTRMLRTEGRLRPYLQVRGGLARLHPRSHLFDQRPLPEDYVLGNSSTKPANGWGVGVIPGLEWNLNRAVALDFSASFGYFEVGDYDLSPVGLPPASSASTFEGHFGVRWHPDNGYPSGPRAPVPGDSPRDAWGVSRNYGWAAVQVLAVNFVSGSVNEYMRNGNFNQTSPRSWWRNIKEGFTYDDNDFRTNQLIHSYNGNVYFNSARSNGLGYWTSAAYAAFGAFYWECCGETHPMSYNDLIATSIGGMTMGEMTYRLSSEILDNQATGKKRFLKELGSFFVDPIRGLNRLISGDATSKDENPSDPMDWRPPHGATLVGAGVRLIGQDSLATNTKAYTNLVLDHTYGDPFDNSRRKPFDYMEMTLQLTASEKQPISILRIRGDLWEKPLGDSETPKYVFAINQFYDYMNNNNFEFGGQSIAPTLYSRFHLSDKVDLTSRVSLLLLSLGAVNSDYADIAQVADRERLREYDYGPGGGADAWANLLVKRIPIATVAYRWQWISVVNGSIYSQGQSSLGSNANHYIQYWLTRAYLPIHGKFGLGADYFAFKRKSRYSAPGFRNVNQHNPRLRVYLAINSAR